MSVLAVVAAPSLAHADDAAPPPLPPPSASSSSTTTAGATTTLSSTANVDSVYLRSGGLYRGRATEIVPGDHVTVVLPSGETKKVPWSDIDRVIVASTPVPPPPSGAAAPAASAPEPEPPMVGPRARVHITSPRQVILYRRPAGTNSWVKACISPCDRELPVGDGYRVAGNGVAQSKEFHLETGPAGFVDVVVDPPSGGGMVLGGIMAGGGATAAYVGMLMALVGASEAGKDCSYYSGSYYSSGYSSSYGSSCTQQKSDGKSVRDAGLVTMAVGAAVTGLGILVFLNSGTTDIAQRAGSKNDASRAPKRNDAFLRLPEWRSASSSAEAATPTPAASFPLLLQGHF